MHWIKYDPTSTPIANKVTDLGMANDLELIDKPNHVMRPVVQGVTDWSQAKWDGTKVVPYSAQDLVTLANYEKAQAALATKAEQVRQTPKNLRFSSVRQKLDLLADSEKRWPTLTDSQKLNLVRVQAQVLVELRDMLEQLYRNKLEEQ